MEHEYEPDDATLQLVGWKRSQWENLVTIHRGNKHEAAKSFDVLVRRVREGQS